MAFEFTFLNWIQENLRCDFLDWLVPKITVLGDSGIIWILIGLAMVISKKYRKQGVLVWIGLLMGLFFGNLIVKNLVARTRPFNINTDIQLLIPIPSEYSFPSGHTLSSTIAATIVTLTNKKFGWIVIPLAVLIAFSRLYLYVHFPTDILGGIVMGVVIGSLTYFVGKIVIEKMKKENQILNK